MNEVLAELIYNQLFKIKDDEQAAANAAQCLGRAITEFITTHCRVNYVYSGSTPSGVLDIVTGKFSVVGLVESIKADTFEEWKKSIQALVVSNFRLEDTSLQGVNVLQVFPFLQGFNLSQSDLNVEEYFDTSEGCKRLWAMISTRIIEWLSNSFVKTNIPATRLGSSGYINIISITFE